MMSPISTDPRSAEPRGFEPIPGRPGVLLAVAAVLVGIAITAEGDVARLVNGVGAVCWIVAAVLLVRSLRGARGWQRATCLVAGLVLALALVVRPSDLLAAGVGFLVAGGIVAAAVTERPLAWALLVPAGWLPAHIAVAVTRSLLRDGAAIRTDPPPTTALVPLAMVLAAAAGASIVGRLRADRRVMTSSSSHAD